jgi:hypothetical protein
MALKFKLIGLLLATMALTSTVLAKVLPVVVVKR